MSAREIIAGGFLMDIARADGILKSLTDSGYRILAPGELDPVTIRKCEQAARGPYATTSKYDENSPNYGLDLNPDRSEFGRGTQCGREQSVAAIRALDGAGK